MAQVKGIDVSYANGKLDWNKLKNKISFAIVRAGYATTVDVQAARNLSECNRLGIPVGVYWFSYALDSAKAALEAQVCCEFLRPYKIDLPVAYDFEYDSVNYAKKKGVTITSSLMCEMAKTFLNKIKGYGYEPMLYTNIDFLNRGFSKISKDYKLWLAQWGVSRPSKSYTVWQYADDLRYDGFPATFDGNIADESFIIKSHKEEESITMNESLQAAFYRRVADEYFVIAEEVLKGKWGNGAERKKKLKEAGYDYTLVQSMVNELIK